MESVIDKVHKLVPYFSLILIVYTELVVYEETYGDNLKDMEVAQKLHFDACDIQNEELNISCHTNSSGCDVDDILDSSAEDLGCSPPLQPKKLFRNTMGCCDSESK